jgi:hypothetical protein
MATNSTEAQSSQARPAPYRRNKRNEPHPLGGNFILMPSLLDYLSPDLTLPEQYFYSQRNDDGMGAEKALMYAVLKDGIRSFYKYVGSTRRKYRRLSDEAEAWITTDSWDEPFSFRVICDTLGIDPDGLRSRLMDWKRTEMVRRELTGDTSSAQVGRSPFPSLADDGNEEDPQMSFEEDPAEDREADLWDSGDQLSLEELELENVA